MKKLALLFVCLSSLVFAAEYDSQRKARTDADGALLGSDGDHDADFGLSVLHHWHCDCIRSGPCIQKSCCFIFCAQHTEETHRHSH